MAARITGLLHEHLSTPHSVVWTEEAYKLSEDTQARVRVPVGVCVWQYGGPAATGAVSSTEVHEGADYSPPVFFQCNTQ